MLSCIETKIIVDDLIESALDNDLDVEWVVSAASNDLEVTEKIKEYIECHFSVEYKNIYFKNNNDNSKAPVWPDPL